MDVRNDISDIHIPAAELYTMRTKIKKTLGETQTKAAETQELLNKTKVKYHQANYRQDSQSLMQKIRTEKLYLEDQIKKYHKEETVLIDRIKDIDVELEDLKRDKVPIEQLLPDNLKKYITPTGGSSPTNKN